MLTIIFFHNNIFKSVDNLDNETFQFLTLFVQNHVLAWLLRLFIFN